MSVLGDRPFYRGGRQTSTVTVDTALELLSDAHRRAILEYLASTPGSPVDYGAVVDHIVKERPDGRQADPQTVTIECVHSHLPKLEDAGLVEFDRESGDVRYRRDGRVEYLLDAVNGLDR